jgi:ATP-dependent DNA helicase RecG
MKVPHSYHDMGGEPAGKVDNFGDLYPIYPQTKGVESWDIQRAVNFARSVVDDVPEVVPDEIRDEYDVVDARTAVDLIHAPDTFSDVSQWDAQDRLRIK